jgi:preprotein translocase SecE subunit
MFVFRKIGSFFAGVVVQGRKVRWPLGRKLFNAVLVTIIFSLIFAFLLDISNNLIYLMLRAIGMNS